METNYALVRIISVLTFIYITRLIYSHKLKIGYSWFLFLLGMGFLILSIWPGAINLVSWITGSTSWLNNVLFFLIVFLFIIVVHCTIMISSLTYCVKELGQQIAISFAEIDEKNLNKLIDSLQTINTKITRTVLNDEEPCVTANAFNMDESIPQAYSETVNAESTTTTSTTDPVGVELTVTTDMIGHGNSNAVASKEHNRQPDKMHEIVSCKGKMDNKSPSSD